MKSDVNGFFSASVYIKQAGLEFIGDNMMRSDDLTITYASGCDTLKQKPAILREQIFLKTNKIIFQAEVPWNG